MKRNNCKKKHSGVALILAITMVIVLALIGIGLLQLGRNARLQAVRDVLQISARSAADAGIEHAVRYMVDEWNVATNKAAWLSSWNDPTEWTDPAVPATELAYSFGPVNLGGTYGDAQFQYDMHKGTKSAGYQIVSTGTAGGRTRTVHAAVVLRSSFFGIGAKDNITINNNAGLATIPVDDPFLIMTLSTGSPPHEGIMLRNGIIVPGNVTVGYGGDTDVGIIEKRDVTIDGDSSVAGDIIEFPSINPPDPPLPAGSWIEDAGDPNVVTISSDGEFAELLLGAVGDTHKTLKITGDVTIYVTGQMILGSDTQLVVTEGSTLTLYLGESLLTHNSAEITYGSGVITTEAEITEAAESITIKGTETCDSIIIQNSGDFYGSIYAPDAAVDIRNSGSFYGALIGGAELKLNNSGNFVFVTALYDLQEIEVLYMGIKKGSWWEE